MAIEYIGQSMPDYWILTENNQKKLQGKLPFAKIIYLPRGEKISTYIKRIHSEFFTEIKRQAKEHNKINTREIFYVTESVLRSGPNYYETEECGELSSTVEPDTVTIKGKCTKPECIKDGCIAVDGNGHCMTHGCIDWTIRGGCIRKAIGPDGREGGCAAYEKGEEECEPDKEKKTEKTITGECIEWRLVSHEYEPFDFHQEDSAINEWSTLPYAITIENKGLDRGAYAEITPEQVVYLITGISGYDVAVSRTGDSEADQEWVPILGTYEEEKLIEKYDIRFTVGEETPEEAVFDEEAGIHRYGLFADTYNQGPPKIMFKSCLPIGKNGAYCASISPYLQEKLNDGAEYGGRYFYLNDILDVYIVGEEQPGSSSGLFKYYLVSIPYGNLDIHWRDIVYSATDPGGPGYEPPEDHIEECSSASWERLGIVAEEVKGDIGDEQSGCADPENFRHDYYNCHVSLICNGYYTMYLPSTAYVHVPGLKVTIPDTPEIQLVGPIEVDNYIPVSNYKKTDGIFKYKTIIKAPIQGSPSPDITLENTFYSSGTIDYNSVCCEGESCEETECSSGLLAYSSVDVTMTYTAIPLTFPE